MGLNNYGIAAQQIGSLKVEEKEEKKDSRITQIWNKYKTEITVVLIVIVGVGSWLGAIYSKKGNNKMNDFIADFSDLKTNIELNLF